MDTIHLVHNSNQYDSLDNEQKFITKSIGTNKTLRLTF